MILAIFGASGQGKEVRDIAEYQNEKEHRWDEMVFIDDFAPEVEFMGLERMHFDTVLKKYGKSDIEYIIALGEPRSKKKVYDLLTSKGCVLTNVISPDCQISRFARLGRGLIVKRGAIISADVEIGDNTTVQSYACIGHDVRIGKHCQISTHVDIGGRSVLGDCVFVGLNAPVRDHLHIGDNVIISAGAAVLKDIEPNVTVMGNPARVVARNTEDTKVFG